MIQQVRNLLLIEVVVLIVHSEVPEDLQVVLPAELHHDLEGIGALVDEVPGDVPFVPDSLLELASHDDFANPGSMGEVTESAAD